MKSRTNIHQELMRQQIIEEERNSGAQKYPASKSIFNKLTKNNPNKTIIIKSEVPAKNYVITNSLNLNKRQRSASYTIATELKSEPFSPNSKSPMDLAFSELGNEDALDWNQIEPSITATSDISAQEILEQISRNDNTTISEVCIHDSNSNSIDVIVPNNNTNERTQYLHHNQPVGTMVNANHSSSFVLKSSTSCPANMTNPFTGFGNINNNNNNNNNNDANNMTTALLINYNQQFSANTPPSSVNLTGKGGSSLGGGGGCINPISQLNTSNRTTPNSSVPSTVPDDQKLQWARDRNKKDCHNRIERKRRDYINNQIQELGQLLPEKLFLNTESKRNKGGILKNSVIYIQQLQESVNSIQHLQRETQVAESAITSFYKQIQYLQDLLSSNGIPYQSDKKTSCESQLQEWFRLHQQNSKILQSLNSIQASWQLDSGGNNSNQLLVDNRQAQQLHHRSSLDTSAVKEEPISVDSVLNFGSLQRAQTISSGGGSSSAGTTPSASTTNFNSPSTSCGGGGGSSLSQQKRTTSSSNVRSKVLITDPHISSPNALNQQQHQHHQHQQQQQQQQQQSTFLQNQQHQGIPKTRNIMISDNPVLSSILIGNNSGLISNNGSRQQAHVINHGMSNSVPDQLRNTFLNQSVENDRYYLIPISKTISVNNQNNFQFISTDMKRGNHNVVRMEDDDIIDVVDDDDDDVVGGEGSQLDDRDNSCIIMSEDDPVLSSNANIIHYHNRNQQNNSYQQRNSYRTNITGNSNNCKVDRGLRINADDEDINRDDDEDEYDDDDECENLQNSINISLSVNESNSSGLKTHFQPRYLLKRNLNDNDDDSSCRRGGVGGDEEVEDEFSKTDMQEQINQFQNINSDQDDSMMNEFEFGEINME